MAIGYFIRQGDKTTCGGVVLDGCAELMMYGAPQALQGDRVTCGKDGKVYTIMGGVWYFITQGIPVAGSLDSFSSCPCGAGLVASQFDGSYESSNVDANAARAFIKSTVAAQTPSASTPVPVVPAPPPNNLLKEEEEEEEAPEDEGIVLRLGLFFDGTGNNLANSAATEGCHALSLGMTQPVAEDVLKYCAAFGYDGKGSTPDNSYGNGVSNVARLYELYPDDSQRRLPPEADETYIKVYLEGIGTRSGLGDSLYSQGTGRGSTGVVARVEQVPALVMLQLRLFVAANPQVKIRRIEVDLFGFSRGAAAARHCANDLRKGPDSLLARALPAGSPLLTATYAWRHGSDVVLNFIGLFDTVAGIVSPGDGDFSPHNANNPGLDLGLALGIARKVVHLVARDEYRHNFPLTRAGHRAAWLSFGHRRWLPAPDAREAAVKQARQQP